MVHEYYAVYSPSSEDVFNGKGFLPKDVDKIDTYKQKMHRISGAFVLNEIFDVHEIVAIFD